MHTYLQALLQLPQQNTDAVFEVIRALYLSSYQTTLVKLHLFPFHNRIIACAYTIMMIRDYKS